MGSNTQLVLDGLKMDDGDSRLPKIVIIIEDCIGSEDNLQSFGRAPGQSDRTVSGLSLDCLLTVSGLSVDYLWTVTGLSLDCLWIVSGLSLDCL